MVPIVSFEMKQSLRCVSIVAIVRDDGPFTDRRELMRNVSWTVILCDPVSLRYLYGHPNIYYAIKSESDER